MLQITIDIFSGRPSPSWVIDDEEEAQAILKEIATNREVIGQTAPEIERLGYRGVSLDFLADDLEREFNLPGSFVIANGTSGDEPKGLEIATRLVENMLKFSPADETRAVLTPQDENLQKLLLSELASFPEVISRLPPTERLSQPDPSGAQKKALDLSEDAKKAAAKATVCYYEVWWFNPGFWNNSSRVRRNNNCYNYARNWRTDTFAQPGRASGHYPYTITCGNVRDAALSDGAHLRYDCFPASERPRWLMALVIWPGWDYHWYRKHREGFWGHKPGSTRAKNTDNSGHVIFNPRTCDRGPYTDFCAYFYACRSMRIR
jgi:hypothetical protein